MAELRSYGTGRLSGWEENWRGTGEHCCGSGQCSRRSAAQRHRTQKRANISCYALANGPGTVRGICRMQAAMPNVQEEVNVNHLLPQDRDIGISEAAASGISLGELDKLGLGSRTRSLGGK